MDNNQIQDYRITFQTDIRKKNRDDLIKQKRKISSEYSQNEQQLQQSSKNKLDKLFHIQDQELKQKVQYFLLQKYELKQLSDLQNFLNSQDIIQIHQGIIGIRKILSVEVPPIQSIIDANLIPQIIELLSYDQYPHLQLEAAWILTNVASGTTLQTDTIIKNQGIPKLVKILLHKYEIVAEQALWALGNIAGDSSTFRDLVLQSQGLLNLSKLVFYSTNENIIKQGTWSISNLCRGKIIRQIGKPLPSFSYTYVAIPVLIKIISTQSDNEIIQDSMWALSYLTDGPEKRIQQIMQLNIIPGLIQHLDNQKSVILTPTIRCIGNLTLGTDDIAKQIFNYENLVQKLFQCLNNNSSQVKREVCWVLSNFASGELEIVTYLVQNKEFIEKIFLLIIQDCNNVKKEALWIISNLTRKCNPQDNLNLIKNDLTTILFQSLNNEDHKIKDVSLDIVDNILICGQKFFVQNNVNQFYLELEKNGCLKIIEDLQDYQQQQISQKSTQIIQEYSNFLHKQNLQ